jgi:hypothetical protein
MSALRRCSRPSALLIAALLFGSGIAACGGSGSSSTHAGSPPSSASGTAGSPPPGNPAPPELQGTWRLVSRDNPEKGLLFVISDRHYRVPARLAHGDLAVDGDTILFFNAAICGLTLPDGIGRYRWAVEGGTLRFELVGKEPCGGRSDILAGTAYRRIG